MAARCGSRDAGNLDGGSAKPEKILCLGGWGSCWRRGRRRRRGKVGAIRAEGCLSFRSGLGGGRRGAWGLGIEGYGDGERELKGESGRVIAWCGEVCRWILGLR